MLQTVSNTTDILEHSRPAGGRVDRDLARVTTEYLLASYGMRRPPELAARLLALLCDLADKGLPFPPRAEVAALVGHSIEGVDSALSVALARGDIVMSAKVKPGNVQQRESVIRERYYTVSPAIRALQKTLVAMKKYA